MSRQIVTVVNPQLGLDFGKKKRAKTKRTPKKKTAKKSKKKRASPGAITAGCVAVKRNKKGQFVGKSKRKGRRKGRRKNPGSPAVVEVVENKSRRRRRRRNPTGGIDGAWRRAFKNIIPKIGGKLTVAYVVRQWGGAWGTGIAGNKVTSPYAGQGWSLWNYALAGITAYFGGRFIARYNREWGTAWAESIWDDMYQRLIWTELIGRSKTAQDYFGQIPADMIGWDDDPYGNRFAVLDQTGYQPAMLGVERAGPMDGIQAAGPMDGLVASGSWDRRRPSTAVPMGHYSDPWLQRGSKDPYQAAYMQ